MTPVSPSILPAISSEGGGSVGGAGREEGQHVEGEELPAEGVATQGIDGGNAEEEAVQRRTLPSPYMPTLSEIRQHKTTDLPYRSWCDECVEALAREWPHIHRLGPSDRMITTDHPYGLRVPQREGTLQA